MKLLFTFYYNFSKQYLSFSLWFKIAQILSVQFSEFLHMYIPHKALPRSRYRIFLTPQIFPRVPFQLIKTTPTTRVPLFWLECPSVSLMIKTTKNFMHMYLLVGMFTHCSWVYTWHCWVKDRLVLNFRRWCQFMFSESNSYWKLKLKYLKLMVKFEYFETSLCFPKHFILSKICKENSTSVL